MRQLDEPNVSGTVLCHNIPETSGVYFVTDAEGNVLYVGSTSCLRRRIAYLEAHVRDSSSGGYTHDASDPLIRLQAAGVEAKVHWIESSKNKTLERGLRAKYSPPWNRN